MPNLFRKNALDTLATPEQLDKHTEIISVSIWVVFLILIVGTVTFVLWSFTYHITNGINIDGIVFSNNNIVQKKAVRNCIVTDVFVSQGEYVEAGDIVAVISYDEILDEINLAKSELLKLENNSEYSIVKNSINELIDKYIAMTVIKSSCSGYVQSVISDGTALVTGDLIFSVMPDSGYDEVISYVPMQTAKGLSLGMQAQISPVYAPREEYGYMTGTITSVGDIPVSEESILAKMGTLSYTKDILPETSFVEIRIRLDLNPEAENNYQWSNKKGEKLSVGFGTQCSVIAVTDEYRPIELLLN